jgi:hypothetical protein
MKSCSVLPDLLQESATETSHVVARMSDSVGFGLEIGFIDHLRIVTTGNCLTEFHTPNVTVTTARIKPSQSSIVVFWSAYVLTVWHVSHN